MHLPGLYVPAVLCLLFAPRLCCGQNSTRKWFLEPFGMLQTNLREIDVGLDVNVTADAIKNHGANAWLITVGGILAFYPTDLEFQKRNPYLAERESGDLIQDARDATLARNMRLLGRMDFSKVQPEVAEEHPEWLFVSPNRTYQNHTNGLLSVCPSGQYYQERIFDILGEVMERYALDGFFVNWASMNEVDYWRVYHGVCHCESCQARWSEFSDEELPNGPEDDLYQDWQEFSSEIIGDWTARVRAFIAERLPDAGLILGTSSDIMFHESNNAVGREFWPHHTAEYVSMMISYRPEVPVLVNSAIFLDMIYRFASENPRNYKQYFMQAIARGANPSTYIMGPPGKIEWEGLGVAGEVTRFHAAWKDVYDGMVPSAKTALVLPDESQMTSDEYEGARSEFRGLYSAMQELHVPFDVVGAQYISRMADNGGLQRYKVIVLPNLGSLGSNATRDIDAWVSDGGVVIATGNVGLGGDGELELQSLPATRQLSVVTEEDELWSHYMAPRQDRVAENYYSGPIVPIIGTYHTYSWKENAEGRYLLLDFAPFAPPEYTYGNQQVNERGCGIAGFDNGTGILFPFTVGRGYRETGLDTFRGFFALLLNEYRADEPLQFNIAEQVEITVNTNGPRTIVHLINLSGVRHQNIGTHLPIPAGTISLPSGSGNVTVQALVANTTFEVEDGKILLPEMDDFEVLVIEGLA